MNSACFIMSGKLEIQWSPVQNKFITWGAEISLYQIFSASSELSNSSTPTPQSNILKISDTHYAQLITVNTNLMHSIRSVDIYPRSDTDLLLAAGLANGRVTLITFGPTEYDLFGYPGKEFLPRHSRHCNSVQFNPSESNLIAAGLDKYRSDSSVLIWDINKLMSNGDNLNNTRMMVNNMAPAAVELVKPVAEFGTSEITFSLSWFYGSSRLLACGMNAKNIKIYDLRDPNKMVNSTLTKAVFGVSTNRNDDRQIVSFYENQVFVWDMRNFEKPVVPLPQTKPVLKVGWCSTKQNCLASLQKESSVINLYNIQQTVISNEEVDPMVMERIIAPGSPHNITSFSWHQSDENRLLTIAVSGTIKDYTVFDRMTINWSATSNFVWSFGSKILKILDDSFLNDITQEIKERAKIRYGLQEDFRKNADLVKNNESLANVWNWLHLTEKLNDESIIKNSEYKHPGIKYILSKIDSITNKSEIVTLPWADLGYPSCHTSAIYYRHPDREKALKLCCWPLNRDSPFLTQFLDCLEGAGAFTRAAAIAVFNLRVHLAIEILGRAENTELGSTLNIVAMALSGFSDDPNSVWKRNCSAFREKLADPYLKAMFCFLTADGYNYEATLSETGIAVDDRVALACLYLPDDKLLEFIDKLSEELCSEGNLDGLLVTGNSRDGLKLLQKYVDNTADIQSTTLIAVRAFHDYLGTETVKNWIIHYRELLNTWRMFHERADFDIVLAQFTPNEKPPQQVYVSCSFCGKSVSASMQERGQYQRSTSSTKVKMSSCPNCRKPLPRCSICLMYMGTSAGDSDPSKIIAFENWFTWCQTCRHGGHAGHISEWFEEHQECPVSGCTCRCNAIDAAALRN